MLLFRLGSGFSVTLNFDYRRPKCLSLSNVYKNGAAGYGYITANFESQQMPEVKVATSEYASALNYNSCHRSRTSR